MDIHAQLCIAYVGYMKDMYPYKCPVYKYKYAMKWAIVKRNEQSKLKFKRV